MFESIEQAAPDAILGLAEAFRNDTHPNKVNLTVGVYQDDAGKTPILECVRQAEEEILANESSKAYLGIDGLPAYRELVPKLLFGESHKLLTAQRVASIQSPGGTGALKIAADFLHAKLPHASIWCSKPTWANHPHIFKRSGVNVESYDYLAENGTDLDFERMIASLEKIPSGDAVCLHACCHNPTGVDPSDEQWQQIANVLRERELLPIFDCAYQGFGLGLREDVQSILTVAEQCSEILICSSFSKNFGLYGERVGALTMVAASADSAQNILSQAKACVRANYSNPPRHGASIVANVLANEDRKQLWVKEVAMMRDRILEMREAFVGKMTELLGGDDFGHILRQKGMFSFSGLTPLQVDQLRNDHSIYIVGSGRINVAGMTRHNLPKLTEAISNVIKSSRSVAG